MTKARRLWPNDLITLPLRTPYLALQGQAWHLNKLTNKRVNAEVTRGDWRDSRPDSFHYALEIRDVGPGAPVIGSLSYRVLDIRHGEEIYPAIARPGDVILHAEEELDAYLIERLASQEVRSMIRTLASSSSSDVYCESLVADEYDVSPLQTPFKILQDQALALRKKTDGLVQGIVSIEGSILDAECRPVRISLVLAPEESGAGIREPFKYKVIEIEHGWEIYPLIVHPGEIELGSEADFLEFLRQEFASREVREAIALLASYTRDRESQWSR